MIYLTGDTHGRFERIGAFCDKMQTDRDDILIILGDAGINFHADARDNLRKEYLARLPITLFCIHGNHERRPESLDVYDEREWHGGQVFTEDRYPNILFAKDGEIYDLDGQKAIAIGGAYSIDKAWRVEGRSWWPDEQPSEEIKSRVEQSLEFAVLHHPQKRLSLFHAGAADALVRVDVHQRPAGMLRDLRPERLHLLRKAGLLDLLIRADPGVNRHPNRFKGAEALGCRFLLTGVPYLFDHDFHVHSSSCANLSSTSCCGHSHLASSSTLRRSSVSRYPLEFKRPRRIIV